MPHEVLIVDTKPEVEDTTFIHLRVPLARFAKYPSDARVLSVAWTKVKPADYPSLRYLVNRSMGTEHIDHKAMQEAGVKVLQIGDYCSNAIAGYVIDRFGKHFPGVHRERIAVVGMGRVGRTVADLLARGPYIVQPIHHDDWEWDVMSTLRECAGVTLHLPLTSQSEMWLNMNRIRCLDGAVIVNTARARLIHNKALLWGLGAGHIRHAYLDVGRGEALRSHPQVHITPHVAHFTPASRALRAEMTVALLEEALDGIYTD